MWWALVSSWEHHLAQHGDAPVLACEVNPEQREFSPGVLGCFRHDDADVPATAPNARTNAVHLEHNAIGTLQPGLLEDPWLRGLALHLKVVLVATAGGAPHPGSGLPGVPVAP